MVRLSAVVPAFAVLFATSQAAAIPEANPNPEPYTPPEQYYPSPTTEGEPAAKQTGASTYKLYPSPTSSQTLAPVPTPNRSKVTTSSSKTKKPHKSRTTETTTSDVPESTVASSTTSSEAPAQTSSGPFCTYDHFGLISPANGSTLIQVQKSQYDDYENGTNMTILYCSSQYYKTSSLDIDVLMSGPDGLGTSGLILAKDVTPTPGAADAGLYGYYFNVTVYPTNGQFATGEHTISVYERHTGYSYRLGYALASAKIDFEVIKEQ